MLSPAQRAAQPFSSSKSSSVSSPASAGLPDVIALRTASGISGAVVTPSEKLSSAFSVADVPPVSSAENVRRMGF